MIGAPDISRRSLLGAFGILTLAALLPRRAFAAHGNFSAEDVQDLDRISAYMNRLSSAQAKFTQIDQWGQMREGAIYLQRPGKLRFEYQTPQPDLVIIADGTWLYVQNNTLKTTTHYDINATPLKLLVRDKIDLAAENDVVELARAPGMLGVTARDDKGLLQGEITLNFSDPGIELRNWVLKDAQGVSVQVSVRDLKEGVKIDPGLFVAENKPQTAAPRKQ
jgi:outer membrane lipoprotein-sorting protein